MSVRVQVILGEQEAASFKSQARKEAKSLSAWLRDAGLKMLDDQKQQENLKDFQTLKSFFEQCAQRENGVEPEWEEHKKLINEGYRSGSQS